MNLEKYIKKISIVALFALTVSPSFGQDLLARQAPVDRRMRALDTLALRSIEIKENRENPAAQLYEDFNNQYPFIIIIENS